MTRCNWDESDASLLLAVVMALMLRANLTEKVFEETWTASLSGGVRLIFLSRQKADAQALLE